jgi:hypothetical protein
MKNLTISPEIEQLAAALGVPLFRSDAYLPRYRDGMNGRWKLIHGAFSLDRGYHSGVWGVCGLPALLRDVCGDGQQWETWMSLSPHEIESQELGPRYAYGHSVVMGLGMGWVAANIALNPGVRRVTVIERDPEVIALFADTQAFAGLPAEAAAKLRIVQADALQWLPDDPVDFLYADIWLNLEEPQTLDEVRRMQANVNAAQIYFWGQELCISRLAGIDPATAESGEWAAAVQRSIAERIALPLLCPADFDYAALVANVVKQRRLRWPGGVSEGGYPVA